MADLEDCEKLKEENHERHCRLWEQYRKLKEAIYKERELHKREFQSLNEIVMSFQKRKNELIDVYSESVEEDYSKYDQAV